MSELQAVTELISVTSESVALAPTLALVPPLAVAALREPPKERRPRRSIEGNYCEQLEWLLLCGDAAMGARGTLAGVVSQIERGSVGGTSNLDEAGTFKHGYTDQQLGTGILGIGEVELHRHLMAAWRLVPAAVQNTLCKRYSAPRAQYRADQGFGAKDRYVEGSDGRVGQHDPTRTGSNANTNEGLGVYAALAFELCDDAVQLFVACVEPAPVRKGKINRSEQVRRAKLVREALNRAHGADADAHDIWFAAKRAVPGLRSFQDRTGRARSRLVEGVPQVGRAARSGRAMRTGDAAFAEDMRRGLAAAQAAE